MPTTRPSGLIVPAGGDNADFDGVIFPDLAESIEDNYKLVLVHGAVAGTARPADYDGAIEWRGTVEPTNAANGDEYLNTTTGERTLKVGGAFIATYLTPASTRVYRSTAQTIGTASSTAISFNAEAHDGLGAWDVGAPTRLTVPAGVDQVELVGFAPFTANTTGHRMYSIRKNGLIIATHIVPGVDIASSPHGICVTTGPLTVIAGDYFELFAYQNSGGNLDVPAGSSLAGPFLTMLKLKVA